MGLRVNAIPSDGSAGRIIRNPDPENEAERYLRQALLRQRNAEIAAHLGEVLWVQGRRDDARRVWNEALRMDPSDRVLRETLERFDVKL